MRIPRRLAATVLAAALIATATACTNDVRRSPTAGVTPSAVPTDPGATPVPSAPTTTETDWGAIWDRLPAGFPTFPGSSPAETGEGPASAILDVGDVEPREVATFYQSNLESAGFSTLSLSGPLEDGSLELESVGEATCRIRTTIAPLGASTFVTVLYGSDCPFE